MNYRMPRTIQFVILMAAISLSQLYLAQGRGQAPAGAPPPLRLPAVADVAVAVQRGGQPAGPPPAAQTSASGSDRLLGSPCYRRLAMADESSGQGRCFQRSGDTSCKDFSHGLGSSQRRSGRQSV